MLLDHLYSRGGYEERMPTFLDVFAGCGGLSLGLVNAGWTGLAAIESSPMAFRTFQHNFLGPNAISGYSWLKWLPEAPIGIEDLVGNYRTQLAMLKGNVDLIAGGPPCQGFSLAGRRKTSDQRNRLFNDYLQVVDIVTPKVLIIENVSGFANDFKRTEKGKDGTVLTGELYNAHVALKSGLEKLGYRCFFEVNLMARDFGVPQLRPRYINLAVRRDIADGQPDGPFPFLKTEARERVLNAHALPLDRPITLEEAISDLLFEHGTAPVVFPRKQVFRMGCYGPATSIFQQVMRKKPDGSSFRIGELADSHRFPNHKPETVRRFRRIISQYAQGKQLKRSEIRELDLRKHRIASLSPSLPCNTLTSLPDDLVHYHEPRVPTVREYARIQSFPDFFEFKDEYTTGGGRRRMTVPRYTQIANAVPPLLAQAIGLTLRELYCGEIFLGKHDREKIACLAGS